MGCILGKVGGDGPFSSLFFSSAAPGHGSSAAAAPEAAGDKKDLLRPPLHQIFSAPKDAAGWPLWLAAAAGDTLRGWAPRRADSFEKLEKIGSGTYSNVYKAADLETGSVVALKKVRVDGVGEAERARFMVREIALLRRLDGHVNVIRLEGLVTSRVAVCPSLYLVFEYMEHDLAGLVASAGAGFTLPQVKCYMKQLFSGLEHCHGRGVLHRDIKSSNLLLSKEGILKIADFGLATSYDPNNLRPMTSQVITLWYRPPELILGATLYGVGVDMWSAGCILVELLTGQPLFPGRTEVEQLHKIFKLCGTPPEGYWEKLKLPHATYKNYDRSVAEKFKDLPLSALQLIETLLALDPMERGTATDALNSDFFMTEPCACEPSSLPQYPPSKEMDIKLKNERRRRKGRVNGSVGCETMTKWPHNPGVRGVLTPQVNGKQQTNREKTRLLTSASVRSKNEKFPPPHLDAAIGFNLQTSSDSLDTFFVPSILHVKKMPESDVFGPADRSTGTSTTKNIRTRARIKMSPSSVLITAFRPYAIGAPMDPRRKARVQYRAKGS